MERRVGPADCALAIALPLTWAEFAADGASPERDFVRSTVKNSGRAMRRAWEEVYVPRVVRTCERVADRVRELGGTVVIGATASVLRELLASFPVVCLVAHSVFASIEAEDLIDTEAVLRLILTGKSLMARHLRAKAVGRLSLRDSQDARRALAAFLESSVESTRRRFETIVRGEQCDSSELVVNRVLLGDCFGPAMRRAGVLELRDGMHTMNDLVAAIPLSFQGVLELAVCNSVGLGESIKRRWRDCLVVENAHLVRIDLRLARYALVMRMLAAQSARYTDALCDLTLELANEVQ